MQGEGEMMMMIAEKGAEVEEDKNNNSTIHGCRIKPAAFFIDLTPNELRSFL